MIRTCDTSVCSPAGQVYRVMMMTVLMILFCASILMFSFGVIMVRRPLGGRQDQIGGWMLIVTAAVAMLYICAAIYAYRFNVSDTWTETPSNAMSAPEI